MDGSARARRGSASRPSGAVHATDQQRPSGRFRAMNPQRPLHFRVWDGMQLGPALRLLLRGRLRIAPRRLYMAWFLVWLAALNSALAAVQRAVYGRQIEATRLARPPLFILGHWRSGTTLLHELFALDDRFTAPTTYECLAPAHFLVSRRLLGPIVRRFTPQRRPMDDMPVGLDLPQEDEFALLALGLPSPYTTLAFPNQGQRDRRYLDFDGVSAADRTRWQRGLTWFLHAVTLRRPRALVLKSPPHLGRLPLLLEVAPDARFVHIVRDPAEVFPSTVRLWRSLFDVEAFEEPTGEGLEEDVLATFERLYRSFEAARALVAPSRLAEVRFEDLVRDPTGVMAGVYTQLELGGFEEVQPRIAAYFEARRNYRPHAYQQDPALAALLERRWGRWMRRYGYGAAAGIVPSGEVPSGSVLTAGSGGGRG